MRSLLSAVIASLTIASFTLAGTDTSCGCLGDLTGDGAVDGADLGVLLAAWNTPGSDLNGDGATDGADLGTLLAAWGTCSDPSVPENDLCQNGIELTLPSFEILSVPFCTAGATSSGPAITDCGFATDISKDVWYRFTAPAPGILTLSTCGTADFDTVLQVTRNLLDPTFFVCPTGDPFGPVQVGCNDDTIGCAGATSHVEVEVFTGLKYMIRVGGYDSASGSGTLDVSFDSFGSSCTLPKDEGTSIGLYTSGTTLDNPIAATPPCGFGPSYSEWITWIPAVSGPTILSTCENGTDFDTVLAVWTQVDDQCVGLPVACNDDFSSDSDCDLPGPGGKSRLQFNAFAGTKYWIQVTGFNGAKGNYELVAIQ